MSRKKITLNELKTLVKEIIKEEKDKKIFNLYHLKSLSPSDSELVLTDKTGNQIYLYKKEKSDYLDDDSQDIWVLYDTDTTNGEIKLRTPHRMSKIIVNVLPFEDIFKIPNHTKIIYVAVTTKPHYFTYRLIGNRSISKPELTYEVVLVTNFKSQRFYFFGFFYSLIRCSPHHHL